MLDFLRHLFATDFMPHVLCLRLPEVVWLHVISDSLIAGSYFLIPIALVMLIRQRRDLAFSWMFALFGVFILACGATHVLGVYTLWHPVYRFDGVIKAATALASMPTAILLFRLLPKAVSLPSPADLTREVEERKAAEAAVRRLNSELEKRVEERTMALAASEARFRAAVEAVGDIIWTNTADGRMMGEQPDWSAFTGQTPAQYENYGWAEAVHPDDAQPTLDAWNKAVAERSHFVFTHRVRRHDGAYRLFSIRGVPVRDDAGNIREWVGVHADITEARQIEDDLRNAKQQAEAASSAKSAFLAKMSHELRTPLNAILGYTELLEEEARQTGSPTMIPDLQRVQKAGRHLLGLIDNVLDLSRIEAGRMALTLENFSVEEVVRDAADTSRPLFGPNHDRFALHLEPGLAEMRSDAGKLRQCLLNLLSNAARFTHGASVTLDVSSKGPDRIEFRVSDNGPGISPAQLSNLFEPFAQREASGTQKPAGTGLGLALTRRFARIMGGHISVESRPGEGACFTMQLPRLSPVDQI